MFQIRNRDHYKFKKCMLNKPKSCIKVNYKDNIQIDRINKLLSCVEDGEYPGIDIFDFDIMYLNFDYISKFEI